MKKVSYKLSGVDIAAADATKKEMAGTLRTNNKLVLNKLGAFASLCDGSFEGIKHPVLVCKTEEPGSKQLLAFKHNRIEGICLDLINHLVNDVIVMGAKPLFIQDLIVCGKMEKDVINQLVKFMMKAAEAQGAVLTGGETSEQPGVLAPGTYVLGASCIGVVEKDEIIDGSKIEPGDAVLAVESSGLHTNGYSLVRALIKEDESILKADVAGRSFLDVIMEPHRCYYAAFKDLFGNKALHGMAHITGGGIPGNLNRILPEGMDAEIDASKIQVLPIFKFLKKKSENDDADMIKTFNLGVGATLVIDPKAESEMVSHLKKHAINAYSVGNIVKNGTQCVKLTGSCSYCSN